MRLVLGEHRPDEGVVFGSTSVEFRFAYRVDFDRDAMLELNEAPRPMVEPGVLAVKPWEEASGLDSEAVYPRRNPRRSRGEDVKA